MIHFRADKAEITDSVAKTLRRAGYRALERLGFLVRSLARKGILFEKGPSEPGTPPHSHKRALGKRGRFKRSGALPDAILYALDKESPVSVVVGPSFDRVGDVGKAHEFGGQYGAQEYPARPFMRPAMDAEIGQLPGLLAEQMENLS